jgi:hypothetical protein
MKKAIIIVIILGALVLAAGWLVVHSHHTRKSNMVEFETDLTETLVRGIIQEMDAGQPKYYYVAFGEGRTDPSRLFMARFASHIPPTRGISSAYDTRNGQVTETAHARLGVIIQIVRFKKIDEETMDVLVQFPNQAAGENRFAYRLSSQGGKWSIQRRLPIVLNF